AAENQLEDCRAEVRVLLKQLQVLRDSYRTAANAQLFLPAYAPYLERDPADEAAWTEAVDTTIALQAVLTQPPDKAPGRLDEAVKRINRLSEDVQGNLDRLRRPLAADNLKRLLDEGRRADPETGRQLRSLLEIPWPGAQERARVWVAAHKLAGRLSFETM